MAVGSGSIVIPPTDLLEDINNIWSDSSGTSSSRCSTQEEAIWGPLAFCISALLCSFYQFLRPKAFSVTLTKADASPTSDIGDDGWEEGQAKSRQTYSTGAGKGLSKSTAGPWSLAISALTSPPGLVLPISKSILRDEKCGSSQGSFRKQGKGTWQMRRHILLFNLLKELPLWMQQFLS